VRTSHVVGAIAILILLVVLTVVFLTPVRSEQAMTPSAAPATSAAARPSATLLPTTPAPTTPAPSPIPNFVDRTYGFSLVLPEPYRKSERLSLANTGSDRPAAQDAFTARTVEDETSLAGQRCETACPIWNYVAIVEIHTRVGSQSPRDWYTAFGGATGERIEELTVDGRPAVKVTNGVPYPVQLIVKDGDRMLRVGYDLYDGRSVPPGASKDKLERILGSFRFLR